MLSKDTSAQGEYYFSEIYGCGVYAAEDILVPDPLNDSDGAGMSPVLVNCITGERFFAKRLEITKNLLSKNIESVLHPAADKCILWPSDIVFFPIIKDFDCNVFVANQYTDAVIPNDRRYGNYAMLFAYDGIPELIGFDKAINEVCSSKYTDIGTDLAMNYRNSSVRAIAASLVYSIWELNQSGYTYCDIHPSRIFVTDNGRVMLDYSNLMYSRYESPSQCCTPSSGWYPLEFCEPSYVQGQKKVLDKDSQNYSLSALLFYMFFGRYAYDGSLHSGYLDNSLQNHYIRFRAYHKTPIFIFDSNNTQNSIGLFGEDEAVIELWGDCPEKIRRLFLDALCGYEKESASEKNHLPEPKDWLMCFKEIGWF